MPGSGIFCAKAKTRTISAPGAGLIPTAAIPEAACSSASWELEARFDRAPHHEGLPARGRDGEARRSPKAERVSPIGPLRHLGARRRSCTAAPKAAKSLGRGRRSAPNIRDATGRRRRSVFAPTTRTASMVPPGAVAPIAKRCRRGGRGPGDGANSRRRCRRPRSCRCSRRGRCDGVTDGEAGVPVGGVEARGGPCGPSRSGSRGMSRRARRSAPDSRDRWRGAAH